MKEFGKGFEWGTAISAYQNEGATDVGGRTPSIWDVFTKKKGKIKDGTSGEPACDFYFNYEEDLKLCKELGLNTFRLSVSWSRVFPKDSNEPNLEGVAFYHRVLDKCIELDLKVCLTLYHWDLPQYLSDKGGWTKRGVVQSFKEYAEFIFNEYKSKVDRWIILNEGIVFTGAGYFLGIHAPGKRGVTNFLSAVHHAVLAQAMAFNSLKKIDSNAVIGTALSMTEITSASLHLRNRRAAHRVDAVLNRLFIEPHLGCGYPVKAAPFLRRIQKFIQPGDEELVKANFDFIGIQNYTREVIKSNVFMPYIQATPIKAASRMVSLNGLGMEIKPDALTYCIRKIQGYQLNVPILITEIGQSYKYELRPGYNLGDESRINYLEQSLKIVKKAISAGVDIQGVYFWTLMDNFEWAEGWKSPFGLIHYEPELKKKRLKRSAKWLQKLLT